VPYRIEYEHNNNEEAQIAFEQSAKKVGYKSKDSGQEEQEGIFEKEKQKKTERYCERGEHL
jgi:hypothetical protein